MKKSFIKSAAVAMVAMLTMSFTTANANTNPTFIYGDNGNTKTVCTVNEDGKTLTPKFKYEYQYTENGQLAEKKAYSWNAETKNWTPAYVLTFDYSDGVRSPDT